jgi:predicted RecA/RadA family phage recombinase
VSDASRVKLTSHQTITVAVAAQAYEIRQLSDGRAGVLDQSVGAAPAESAEFATSGQYVVTKASGIVILDGGRVYWDHSANQATYFRSNDRDFYIGRAVGDAATGDTTVTVNLNVDARDDLDIASDPFDTVIVGTQALGGLGLYRRGSAHQMILSSVNEAQKVDMLSTDGFSPNANAIVDIALRVVSATGTAPDFNIGIANGTNATDADNITESVFIHLDAGSTLVRAESDDGTTEIASSSTGINYTAGAGLGARYEAWIDCRDPANVKIYVNGTQVLTGSTFKIDAAAGPLRLLAHLEKTASTDTAEVIVDWLRARFMEQ